MHGTRQSLDRKYKETPLPKSIGGPWTKADVERHEAIWCEHAREDFYAYRQYMTDNLIVGWYQAKVAQALMEFYEDWIGGLAPVLILEAPPQHGKSRQVLDFIAWCSGHNPDTKSIYASYSDALGLVANATVMRQYASDKFQKIFDVQLLNMEGRQRVSGFRNNSKVIEHLGYGGSFRNTTVNGQITGMGLTLGVIDDPMKGRAEAQSKTIRDKVWGWFTDDFFSRFAEEAGMIMMMTRWHVDDPVGRFMEKYPNAKVLKFPAIGRFKKGEWVAENHDIKKGMALFPEFKSKKFLLKRRKLYTQGSWMSLYQQSPIVVGGGTFPIEKLEIIDALPLNIRRSVRYWDKAGTEGGSGAFTAGVLMHELTDGTCVIEDVVRGHWGALARESRIKQCAALDNEERMVEIWVEQEPGSGGKESAESTIRNLRGYKVFPDKVSGQGSKEIRAEPYAAQVQAGNIKLLRKPWNRPFIEEHETWPNGAKKDQVDAAAGAFNKLTIRKSSYDSSMNWVNGDYIR